MADTYVENLTFTIPRLQNGVHDLGDLWDCRKSAAVQHNLLSTCASSKQIQATPLKNFEYISTHVQNEYDKIRNLKVDGHVSIDLGLTVIKLDGSINYSAKTNEKSDTFIVNYTREDHKIYLKSPLTKNVNRELIQKLKLKQIEATHVVGGIIIGGDFHGVVEVKQKDDSSSWDLAGAGRNDNSTEVKDDQSAPKRSLFRRFMDKLSGCVTGELKATWLKADMNSNSDIRVNCKALPDDDSSGDGPPNSVESMFKCIENMPKAIKNATSFQRFGKDIFGVPIRFILYPLSHYIDFNLQVLYKQLDDSVMRRFQETVSQVIEIQQSAYVKRLILKEDEDVRFLLDSKSQLLSHVSKFEEQLKVIGAEFEERCRNAMAAYKFGKQCQDDIYLIVKEFNQSEAGSIYKKVQEFVAAGRLELLNCQVSQAKSKMMIFTDREILDKWYGEHMGQLVLIETKPPNQPGAIKGLSDLAEFLHILGVDVGMAIPAASNKATLTLKFCGREATFEGEEIIYALDALKTMASIAEPTTATFYRILAALKGCRLSIDKKGHRELDCIVSQIVIARRSYNNIYVYYADSIADLRKQISAVDDIGYVFCLPLGAPDTDLEFLMKWEDFGNVRWVAYNFDFPDLNEAPLLMLFKENRLQAICLDNLDVLCLKHQLLKIKSNDLTMLSPEKLQNCLYPERARYAMSVISRLEPLRYLQLVENKSLLKTRTNSDVEEFLMLVRSFLSGDPSQIVSAAEACFFLEGQILSCTEILIEMESGSPNEDVFERFKPALNAVIDNPHCPASVKEQMNKMLQSEDTVDTLLARAPTILREMKSIKFESLRKIVSICSRPELSVEAILRVLVEEYCSLLGIFKEPLITLSAGNFQPYLLLHFVSTYKHEKGLRLLYEGFRKLTSLDDCDALQQIIQSVSSTFDRTQIEALWKNSQWQFLVQMCIESERNAIVFRALWEWLQSTEYNGAFPENIKEKLNERFKLFSKKLKTVKDVAGFFQDIIDLFEQIPGEFRQTLEVSLKESNQLERELCELLTPPEWNSERKLTEIQWDMNKVKSALSCLTRSIQSKEAVALATDFNLIFLKIPITQHDEPLDNEAGKEVCPRFRKLVGNRLQFVTDKKYVTVKRLIRQPVFRPESSVAILLSLAPYILQEIKMWNGYILKPFKLSSISKTEPRNAAKVKFSDDPFGAAKSSQDEAASPAYSVTRLDIFAYLINAADCYIASDILRVMSKFPNPLPLIVPDFLHEGKHIITVPLLKNILIKWESAIMNENQASADGDSCKEKECNEKVSHIVENHLFSSPFRLVVAIRLGTHKPGKSQLLNQLMVDKNFFSAHGEPGGERGPPHTLDGSVELAWLTKETCDYACWTSVLEAHYASHKDEIVLLANMHGDATQHLNILSYLKKLAFGFLVFLMPEEDVHEKWNTFITQIGNKPVTFLKVDPPTYEDGSAQVILTHDLTHEVTMKTLRNALSRALTHIKEEPPSIIQDVLTFDLGESLRPASANAAEEAQQFVREVSKVTCVETKKCIEKFLSSGYDGWKDNDHLKKIIGFATKLLNSSKGIDLKNMFSYLETELSRLSASESLCARLRVAEIQRQLHDYESSHKVNSQTEAKEQAAAHNERIRDLTDKLKFHMTQAEYANLGLEHFFRVFSHIHRIALGHYSADRRDNSGILELPKYYAALLLEGHALELLNGDASEIPIDWFRTIFRQVEVLQPNMRVYVISIIGLQSSGKSTLLNALFSCRFAVSVGRCSRGLYMRMIFLEEGLRKEHGYDAIILIDTEGLASSEKMNDPNATRKDRLLATFAMGLSNLTIVNVLGEDLTKITDILQIVIVTMARLREADVRPDMLVVQHLQERNTSKLDEAKQQFIGAINKAFELVHEKDVEIGAMHNACLVELIQGVKGRDVFQQFSSFKDGSSAHAPPSESYHNDVVHLYQILLRKARDSTGKLILQRWLQLTENYWNSVTKETFALDFKSAQHITDYLNYNKNVSKLKEAIGQAFNFHVVAMSKKIENKINTWLTENPRKQLDDLREEVTTEIDAQLKTVALDCEEKCRHCECFISEKKKISEEITSEEQEIQLAKTLDLCINRKRQKETKNLEQVFDVSIYRRGCFSEFSDLIRKEVKIELMKRPSGEFSEEEKTTISERIWNRVKYIVSSKEKGSSLLEEIEKAIATDHENIYQGIWQRINDGSLADNLKTNNAKKCSRFNIRCFRNEEPLSKTNLQQLLKKVEDFITDSLLKSNPNYLSDGMRFEAGMITAIISGIPDMLKEYEKEANIEFISDYKDNVIVYALRLFIGKMQTVQATWDNRNKRSLVLHELESVFKGEIRTRLDHGFSNAADGYVQAGRIIDAAKQEAEQAAFRHKIQLVLGDTSIRNSETVRLKYFQDLVIEVSKGRKKRAIDHFRHPRESVETWFRETIELMYSKEKVHTTYEQTLKREIDCARDKVESFSSLKELREFLGLPESVAENGDDNTGELHKNALASFKDSIVLKLKEFSDLSQSEDITCALASEDESVMNRLGCTESCPWCGALCWGSRQHTDTDDTQKHHSCHQPNGLIGTETRSGGTHFLDPRSCQDIPDSEPVFLDGYHEPSIRWSEAKTQHFGSWKFDRHATEQFDEMMHWFFQELHEDMSAASKKSPVPPAWLEKFKCKGIRLQGFLPTVLSITY